MLYRPHAEHRAERRAIKKTDMPFVPPICLMNRGSVGCIK